MSKPKGRSMIAALAALALAIGTGGAASASDDSDSDRRIGDESVSTARLDDSAMLPIEAVLDRLRTQGYKEFRGVEREGDRYEVRGQDARGERVELVVDAGTGDVLKTDRED